MFTGGHAPGPPYPLRIFLFFDFASIPPLLVTLSADWHHLPRGLLDVDSQQQLDRRLPEPSQSGKVVSFAAVNLCSFLHCDAIGSGTVSMNGGPTLLYSEALLWLIIIIIIQISYIAR